MPTALLEEDPERLGGYWLAARLGAGGQGVVYEAYDARGARVAVKALHRGAQPPVRERFGREADAARRVASFCTARVLDASADGETPYIVSEYVPGPTLAEEVRRHGPLAEDALLRMAVGAATALVAIHGAGVVHRDLKPGNVLLGPDGPRIIDFGIARAPDASLTATNRIMGTFGYMAPEVLAGRRATEASDVFAWAAVVVFAASGTEPFRGANIGEVVHRATTLDPDLSALPSRIRPLVAAALAKQPELRPTARELLLGLVGDLPKSADPRNALLSAGAERAAAPEGADRPEGSTTEVVPPLGDRAEEAYAALPAATQLVAQQVLLRLVVPGDAADGGQDSVRTAGRAELYADRPESERRATEAAVTALAAAGALVVGEDDGSVRPVSAALIPAWRRLREWVAAERAGLVTHRRLGRAALAWQAGGERPDDLLRGTALATGVDWLAAAPFALRPSPLELRFLTASRDEAARAGRRRRQLLAGVAVLAALALLAGTVAWFQTRESRRNAAEADRRRAQATARSVAQAADSLRGDQPDTAMLLSLAAWRIAETPESRAALNSAATLRETAVIGLPAVKSTSESGTWLLPGGRTMMMYAPGEVTLWDLTKGPRGAGKPYATVSGNANADELTEPLTSLDGRLLLVQDMGENPSYRVVSVRDGKPMGEPLPRQSSYAPVALTNHGQVLYEEAFTDQTPGPATRYRLVGPSGKLVTAWTSREGEVVLSPSGTHYATCTGEDEVLASVEVWALGAKGRKRVFGGEDSADSPQCGRGISFSADGRLVAAHAPLEGTTVLRTATGEEAGEAPSEKLDSPSLSADGHHVVGTTKDGTIEIWGRDDAEVPLFRFTPRQGQDYERRRSAFDPWTQTLVYATQVPHQVHRLDVRSALSAGPLGRDVQAAAVSADGRVGVFRTGGEERPVQHLMNLRTEREAAAPVPQRPGPGEAALNRVSGLSADGRFLAFTDFVTRGDDYKLSISLWNTRTHKELFRAPVPHGRTVSRIAVSPDGRHLAYAHENAGEPDAAPGTYEVWDARTRKRVHTYAKADIHGRFSPDGRRLVTTRGDVLDLAKGTSRRADFGADNSTDLVFSRDGKTLAVVQDTGWVELWDGAVTGRRARMPSSTVRGASHGGKEMRSPAVSPDGSLLAAVVDDNALQLWDLDSRLALGEPLELMGRKIDDLAFDPGGVLRALSGNRTQAVELTPGRLAATVCRKAGRDLTRAEWRTYVPDAAYRSLC
ncbi:hypothetical protein GCM10018785_21550 [Streptomyces longispororuber]|uniref:Protein kinase domain-containing protein n=1 Tax=Streptomyces longispororuber TaxID=68230 RepID=A0A918ZIB3_9ACTN|nr:WD40 repeat domain-containing serine/threonine protein kinase [Streptomyces longispororuber]GHE51469.1 hypothetical protein GCM10018785_21550 [Streptomyces longispororuber]